MKRLGAILWIIILVGVVGVLYILATIPEKLVLDQSEGPAPLDVHIIAPEDYLKHANSRASAWVGCGIRVDWGDGRPQENVGVNAPCAEMAEHVYYQKGTFKVTAFIGGFQTPTGPTVTTWTGSTIVTVK